MIKIGSFLLVIIASAQAQTFCNPLNLPYHFQADGVTRREAADPVIVLFRDKYWLFASKQAGYWWSDDLLNWHFIRPTGLPLGEYAPSVTVVDGRLYYTSSGDLGTFITDDPIRGQWTNMKPFARGCADPEIFQDTDGKVYLYDGCSDKTALRVTALDPTTMQPLEEARDVIVADTLRHGWELSDELGKAPWIEGSWMNKIGGKYYWQYSGPGTQYKTYGDGVYVSDKPEGPFVYQRYSPFSFKPTGFIAGAGHSSTFTDKAGAYWHIATGTISIRHMFERRLLLFPAAVLDDGQLMVDTYLGDYPQWAPGTHPHLSERPWMLVSYHRPATASSTLDTFAVKNAFDENIRTWWSAATPVSGEWIMVNLQRVCRVNAIQVNFADQGATDVLPDDGYQYTIEASLDGKTWSTLIDRSRDRKDTPHDYVELSRPVNTRYVRVTGLHMPAGSFFSISDLRVFGKAPGAIPASVNGFAVHRDSTDPRAAHIHWQSVPGADFYIIRYGIAPDRLFGNYQVYGDTALDIRSLNVGVDYYFTIDVVNGAGIRKGGEAIKAR